MELGGDGKKGGQAEMMKKEGGKLEWAKQQGHAAVREIEFLDVNVRIERRLDAHELVRFTRICNEEEERDKAWDRFSRAMQRRGHEKRMLERVKAGVSYTERPSLMRKRDEAQESLDIPLIVPHKPGAKEWWIECKKN